MCSISLLKNFRLVSYQLKEDSVNEASATPPTIGTREETIGRVGFCGQYSKIESQTTSGTWISQQWYKKLMDYFPKAHMLVHKRLSLESTWLIKNRKNGTHWMSPCQELNLNYCTIFKFLYSYIIGFQELSRKEI